MSDRFIPVHPNFQDLSGRTHNGWIIEDYRKGKRWILRCPHCGKTRTISTRQITAGHGGSCDCVVIADFDRRLHELDPAFGNWLAGFIDGEGCFAISRKWLKKARTVSRGLIFHIGLRRDDLPILEEIASKTGLGVIRLTQQTKGHSENSKPQARWKVSSKLDCLNLVKLLDRFPLRAKKKNDFLIWREAASVWTQISRMGPPDQRRGMGRELQMQMAQFEQALKDVKTYRCPDCVR